MKTKSTERIKNWMFMLLGILFLTSVILAKTLMPTSFGADDTTVLIETALEKYINYSISDQDEGTLVQYHVKTGIDVGDNTDTITLRSSELAIKVNQIDGKYPYAVKVIAKTTELTNGKTENLEENYEYDSSTGTITINTSNQDENGELINSTQPSSDARDEYVIITYYDTYTERPEERELDVKVRSTVTLSENDRQISQENEAKGIVQDNIGELTSVTSEVGEIYNGYIKSNIINGTNYDTEYKENVEITVSKKEAQQKIQMKENNLFEMVYQDSNGEEITQEFASNGDLVYKSTTIKQEDMKKLLGKNGVIEILDNNENVLATIDENTKFEEDGKLVITYENEPEGIIIKTSNIESEGILSIKNTKAIKSTMQNMDYNKIKTVIKIIGINEEIATTEIESEETGEIQKTEETIEKQAYVNNYENTSDMKESTNNINIDISNTEWTNQYQNEVTFNVYMSTNSTKDNMLKNPSVKIELPSEVEKIILGEASVVYANGLELQDPYLETNENGNIVIVANLVGAQTNYDGNALGLVTDVKISATVILKKNIENTTGNVNLTYTNQYNVNGRTEIENRSSEIKITSYQEESIVEDNVENPIYANTSLLGSTVENIDGLTVEVIPVRGDTVLKDGDTVYEGEFIKYNIKIKNTSDKQIDNIKVVGSIPEGTTYGELEADYYNNAGDYYYQFNEELQSKEIEIGTLEAGKSITKFYEVQVNDLAEEKIEKQIETTIKTYADSTEISTYNINNVVKPAEVKVFLSANLYGSRDTWNYHIKLSSDENKEVTVKVKLPKECEPKYLFDYSSQSEIIEYDSTNIPEDNIFTLKLQTNVVYYINVIMERDRLTEETEESKIELIATASVTENNTTYRSNENRVLFEYESVSISMTSNNEGEEVAYGEEIDYVITVNNIGRTNWNDPSYSFISVKITDFLPENVKPISVTYDNWEAEKEIISDTSYKLTGKYNKLDSVTENISSTLEDKDGNKFPNVDLCLMIPYGESVTITVKTTARFVYEKTKVENSATVSGGGILSKTSNTVAHTILPYNYDDISDPEENPDNPDKPSNPDNPNNPNNPTDEDGKYSISGVAWIDENEDGQRQTDEKLFNGITVMLVNTANSSTIQAKEVTDSNGAYRFSGLEKGNYIVVFNYDTDTYSVTEYQKSGVSTSLNSDAINKEITLMGSQTKVGLTDTISLNRSVSNIDIGLVKNKICDLKLDKYISKVQVKTNSGTKEYTYDNSQLAKVEIKSKEIQGATVVVTYKIVVTNEGELPAYATKVVDYIPDGLKFSSDLNKSWTTTKNGELTNISVANQRIDVGESVELTLVLTKAMTANSTGTFTNIAEIGEIKNSLGVNDIDSTPENKVATEDDYSKADLIISVSTGALIYISIGILLIIMIGIIIFLTSKYGILKIGKISLLITLMVVILFMGSGSAQAENAYNLEDEDCYYRWDGWNSYELINGVMHNKNFYNLNGAYAECQIQGARAHGYYDCADYMEGKLASKYKSNEAYVKYNSVNFYEDETLREEKTIESPSVTLTNNTEIQMKTLDDDNCLLGPFKVNCITNQESVTYSLQVFGKDKNDNITDYTICNENAVAKPLSGKGNITFYLKIPISKLSNGISSITLNAKVIGTSKYKITRTGKLKFYSGDGCQDIKTTFNYTYDEYPEIYDVPAHDDVTWTNINGCLKIKKIDKESEKPLANVKFSVKNSSGSYVIKDKETDSKGEIFIDNLKPGSYTVIEESNPNYSYTVKVEDITKTLKSGTILTITRENEKQTGNLHIEKKDYNNNNKLEGISFKIKSIDSEEKLRADIDQNGLINVEDATYLQKYIAGQYKNDKIALHGLGDVNDDGKINDSDVKALQNYLNTYTYNYMVVSDNKKTYSGSGESVTGIISLINMTTTTNSDEATTFTTDSNGEINILNMLVGDYLLEEVSVGNNFGYEVDGKYIYYNYTNDDDDKTQLGEGKNSIPFTIKRQSSKETVVSTDTTDITYQNKLNVYNKQKYIKLRGYVWEDIRDPSKSNERDNLWDESQGLDKRVNNVLVTLYGKGGNLIDYRITGGGELTGDGSYIFGDYMNEDGTVKEDIKKIKIEELDGAYIKFKYNGMSYESVTTSLAPNGSKATDKNLRDDFNAKYVRIENDKAIGTEDDTEKERTLKYEKNGTTSTLTYGKDAIKGYPDQKFPISGVTEDNYSITASTQEAYPNILLSDIDKILENGEDEIQNINLGVYEREQPDISLKKDLQNVRVSINGYDHVYLYDSYYTNMMDKEKSDNSEVGVEWGYKDLDETVKYTQPIYKSDYEYENATNADKELKVYITYELRMVNESNNLYTTVNSIVDYYDSRCTIVSIGTNLSDDRQSTNGDIAYLENGKLVGHDGKEIIAKKYDANYNKIIINNGTEVNPRSSGSNHESIYVQFELTRGTVETIIHSQGEESRGALRENVAEINSYSTFSHDGFNKIYAGVDEDSNPGNCKPEEKKKKYNYEDDTFACPDLKLEEKDQDKYYERSISGTVFLDESVFNEDNCSHDSNDTANTHTGEERNGDGIYQEGVEKKIAGVKVELYKASQISNNDDGTIQIDGNPVVGTTYIDGQNEGTGEDGSFKISGFIPDEYIIVYTWGDKTYIQDGSTKKHINVNDYKGTIYAKQERQNYTDWYKNYNYDTKRYSDAMDDYEQRKAIDNDSSIITNMNSKTPSMVFGIEYADDVAKKTGTSKWEDECTEEGEYDKLTFKVENVDFGITERARQEVAIDKTVAALKISLANTLAVVNIQIDENGNITGEQGNLQIVPRGYTQDENHNENWRNSWQNGKLWETLDNELIQGAKLEVTYRITASNNSEKDYDSYDYYIYGEMGENENKDDKLIKQKITGVYDYLDSIIAFDSDKNLNEDGIAKFEVCETVEGTSILEKYFKEYNYTEENQYNYTDEREEYIYDIKGYEYYSEEYQEEMEKWASSSETTITVNASILSDKTILKIKELEEKILGPGESSEPVLLYASKDLANTDDITINNDVEWREITRQGKTGRKITPTSSIIYNRGETVTITPPTGEDQNYLPYIILGITSFIILGAGVVIIKKKVLR